MLPFHCHMFFPRTRKYKVLSIIVIFLAFLITRRIPHRGGHKGVSSEEEGVKVPLLLPIPSTLSKPNDSLCDVCRTLDLTSRRFVVLPGDPEAVFGQKPDDPNIHLGSVEHIRKKSHCPFCRLVLTALGPDLPAVEDDESVFVTMSWNTYGPIPDPETPWRHTPQIRILRPYAQKANKKYVNSRGLNLFPEITLLANDAPARKTFFVRFIKDQIDFGMIRNWLGLCRAWHGTTCDKSPMLGDEFEDPSIKIPHFRLVDVINNCIISAPPNAKYIALSYVWGRLDLKGSLKLLKDNTAQLAEPGALLRPEYHHRIPLTIRDAMQVVRELHFRYLWVDILCIIQDDGSYSGSKSGAISNMNLVYGGAYITIMAATGTDANAGLPGLRPGTRGTTQPIEEILSGLRLAYKQKHHDYIRDSVYYTRAWTYQEWLFSKRSLIFIGGQVVYRCQGTDQWREDVFFEDEPKSSLTSLRDTSNDIGHYEGLIQSYSGLSLTYDSDIYHAFGGITRYFNTHLKVKLCHGIPDAYFDWFLLWVPLVSQTRRPGAPSWSWSGWQGQSWPHMWDWYSRNISKVNNALLQRTWIIWYQRKAHNSKDYVRVYTAEKVSSNLTNFYGGAVKPRFLLDSSQVIPTRRKLIHAPRYFEDSYNPSPGSGFLQFWTVSVTFRLGKPILEDISPGPLNTNTRLGIFGRDVQRQLGTVFVNPDWAEVNFKFKSDMSNEHEFVLLCEGRDKRAESGKMDEEDGWKYMVMLIEWHHDGEWAERVAVSAIEKEDLNQALGSGPVWKEIILG